MVGIFTCSIIFSSPFPLPLSVFPVLAGAGEESKTQPQMENTWSILNLACDSEVAEHFLSNFYLLLQKKRHDSESSAISDSNSVEVTFR